MSTPLTEGWKPAGPTTPAVARVAGQAEAVAAPVVPLSRVRAVAEVSTALGVSRQKAQQIVCAFDTFVSQPVESQLRRLKGRHLALRNPMIYTVRGTSKTAEWIDRVLSDKETSALEGHVGTWQEEVARIVSGGIKPPTGVDLQIDDGNLTRLYAIQTAPNTKNAAGSQHDLAALKRSAAVLRNQRRHVECYVAILCGRHRTASHGREPGIVVLASDDFWNRISGVPDFRTRLLAATQALSHLMHERSDAELERIRREATVLFDDGTGKLKIDALANPPRVQPRWENGIQLELTPHS